MRFLDLVNYLTVIAVFFDVIYFPRALFGFADLRGPYILMALVLTMLICVLKKIYFNRSYLIILMIMIIFSVINVIYGIDTFPFLIKQLIGIGLSSIAFYCVIIVNEKDIAGLFRIYLNIALFIGLIGILQQISFVFGFQPGYDFSYFMPSYWQYVTTGDGLLLRINSLTLEPSGFCVVMMPAFFAALVSLIPVKEKIIRLYSPAQAMIIVWAVLLSFSSIGYIGVFVSVLLIVANNAKRKKYWAVNMLIVFISVVFAGYIFINIQDVRNRLLSVYDYSTGAKQMGEINQSATILFSNAHVAFKSFLANPLFGSGIGSHELSYNKYIEEVIGISKDSELYYKVFRNVADANSLFLRLLSETGLIGIFIVFAFIFRYYLFKRQDQSGYLWIINNSILVYFVMRLIRVGHYFDSGFFFFLWLYYFSKVNQMTSQGKKRNEVLY